MKKDFTTREEVLAVYRKRARFYDISANLYYLVGFREWAYRRRAVDALGLKRGDTVVEIGCGTGLNFALIEDKIGPEGRLIGVDLSDAMLAQARNRIERRGWRNVELVCESAARYVFPEGLGGVLSTFALTLEPDYDRVVADGAKALKAGRRWVLLDLKLPSNWLRFLTPLLILLARPFAVSRKVAERQPWLSIERYLKDTTFEELFFGIVYLAMGRA